MPFFGGMGIIPVFHSITLQERSGGGHTLDLTRDRIRLFNRPLSFFIVLLGLPLLFFPKINLIAFGGKETAGIRLDDLILLLLAAVIFWGHFSLQKTMCAIERQVCAIVAFSLLSFAANRFFVSQGWLHVNANLFYCLRILEYFTFFYIGALSVRFFSPPQIIKAFFFWNLLLMLLQKAGLIGQFSVEGYLPSATERVVGIASFPSEAGMFLALAFCYLIYQKDSDTRYSKLLPPDLRYFFRQTRVLWLFLITVGLVTITGSRIAIAALTVVFLFKLKDQFKEAGTGIKIVIALFLSLVAVLTVILMMQTSSIAERSAGLFSMKNIDLIGTVWDHINLNYDPIGSESVKYAAYDMSWWMRIHKWCYALKIYWLNPECWLQGVGPGFAMAALDGGYIRILTECGLIGSFFYWKLFSEIYKQSEQLKWMVIAFAINMIFFDVYLAYKPMSLLFFASGAAWALAAAHQTRDCAQTTGLTSDCDPIGVR